RSLAARRAPSARFVLIKFGQILRRFHYIDGFIHNDHSAGTEHRTRGDDTFVIERDVLSDDLAGVHNIYAGTAGNYGLQLFIVAKHSAAVFENEFFHIGVAHRQFVNAGAFYVAADRPELCAAAFFGAEIAPGRSAHRDYLRNGRERFDVINDRRGGI